ncbi:hypothetical protein GCM10010191_24360 [Actinomadura vinacea]|uniref:SseB protein N-terminal domain-containing protein n=1 Tax=Actinomadura vinacea TaxID=115336 RepID=A0ABN3ITM6_9ACTN
MDWNDFAKRLTIELLRLPVRSFLIVQATGGLPYVQVLREWNALEAEAVGSAFLPRALSPSQERRLTVLGWEPPEDPDTQNWWSWVPLVDRSGRPVSDQAERCAGLAGRMVAAFREVYGTDSPLDLVYQAGHNDGRALALPGLGIPRDALEGEGGETGPDGPPGWTLEPAEGLEGPSGPGPGGALEIALVRAREDGDQNAYLDLLRHTMLYLPAPADPADDDGAGHRYATARFGDGTFVLAFTSPEAMSRSLRGQAVHHRRALLQELVRQWPDPEWQLAIDPGLPSAAYLDATALPSAPSEQPAPPPAADNGHSSRPSPPGPDSAPPERPLPPLQHPPRVQAPPRPAVPPEPPEPPQDVAAALESKPSATGEPEVVVMQKVVRPEHVAHYLEGGYELVAGYVHTLRDVRDLNTPAKLVRGLGLVYEGAPFSPMDEAVHVIRWPALKPGLFRTPLGGIDEWSMGTVPGGWVIEKAPFPGSGYAPGEGAAIPEFKIDSQRLPHGAEMYRIEPSGQETLIGGYDADLRRWLLRPGVAGPAAAAVPAARAPEPEAGSESARVAEAAPGAHEGGHR